MKDQVVEIVNWNYERKRRAELCRQKKRMKVIQALEVLLLAALGAGVLWAMSWGLIYPVLAWMWAVTLWVYALAKGIYYARRWRR